MKVIKGLYVLVSRSLGIVKTEGKVKPKIVILERAQPLLSEFDDLVSNDLLDS